jgi:hypothetical protein
MAIKTRHCPHEPRTKTFRPSRSSRLICCEACYFAELRKVIVATMGEAMAARLDVVKGLNFQGAFLKFTPENYPSDFTG